MASTLKWILPYKWPEGALNLIEYTVVSVFSMVKKTYLALPRPKNKYLRWGIAEPLYVWIAIPGTVPLSLYHIGKLIGYEEELTAAFDISWQFISQLAGIIFSTVYGIASLAVGELMSAIPGVFQYLMNF